MKRLLSLLLGACMLVTSVVPAFAAEPEPLPSGDVSGVEQTVTTEQPAENGADVQQPADDGGGENAEDPDSIPPAEAPEEEGESPAEPTEQTPEEPAPEEPASETPEAPEELLLTGELYMTEDEIAEATEWSELADTLWYWNHADDAELTISSANELAGLAVLVSAGISMSGKTIYLDQNIDLSGRNWTPIGIATGDMAANSLQGVFDGQDHEITGLTIDHTEAASWYAAGLFGAVGNSGVVCNLNVTIESISVTQNSNRWLAVGGVVGRMFTSGKIVNCHATVAGDITAVSTSTDWTITGGLVGHLGSGVSEGCSAEVLENATIKTTAKNDALGTAALVGYAASLGSLERGSARIAGAIVTEKSAAAAKRALAGGLIGNSYIVKDSYAVLESTGSISLTGSAPTAPATQAGLGLIAANNSEMRNVYAVNLGEGNLTGYSGTPMGLLVGVVNHAAAVLTNGYAYTADPAMKTLAPETGVQTNLKLIENEADMKMQATFEGFDFSRTWFQPANSYPVLDADVTDQQAADAFVNNFSFATIAGTNTDQNALDSNLILPTSGRNNAEIVWTSSNSAAISETGAVNLVAGNRQTVTLTGTLTCGSETRTVEITVTIRAVFSGGTGTKEDPFQIATEEDFFAIQAKASQMGNYAGVYLKQTEDITFSRAYTAGDRIANFRGTYDGDGHTLANVTYAAAGSNKTGLFTTLAADGVIKNLGIASGTTTGAADGGILTEVCNGLVLNCWVAADMVNTGGGVSTGIFANNGSGKIVNSYSAGSINAYHCGGFASNPSGMQVLGSYNVSSVVGKTAQGAIFRSTNTGGVAKYSYWRTDGDGGQESSGGKLTDCEGLPTADMQTQDFADRLNANRSVVAGLAGVSESELWTWQYNEGAYPTLVKPTNASRIVVSQALSGAAVEGASVSLYADEQAADALYQGTTNAYGAWDGAVPAGTYFARVSKQGFAEFAAEITVKNDGTSTQIKLLSPISDTIQVWADGQPGGAFDPTSVDAIAMRTGTDSAYYLFLPSSLDRSQVNLFVTAPAEAVTEASGKITLQRGLNTVDLTGVDELSLASGDKTLTLKIMQSSEVAAMFLTTDTGSMDFVHANKNNKDKGGMVLVGADGAVAYDGALTQVKGRGNYTWSLKKKPYQIKLDKKTDLFGMGKAKTWVLLANHFDNTLIRNKLVMDFARELGMPYVPHCEFVDLYANGMYLGNYLLCEKTEIGDNRVEINDLEGDNEDANPAYEDLADAPRGGSTSGAGAGTYKYYNIDSPDDVTGGYLLEMELGDRYPAEASGFVTKRGQPVVMKSPEYASEAEVKYIYDLVQSFENAIYAEDGVDPATGKHFSEIIDLDSLVYKYLLDEFVQNNDAFSTSSYLYKDRDVNGQTGKLYFGPPWDYDVTMGTVGGSKGAASLYINKPWINQMFKQPAFTSRLMEIYHGSFQSISEITDGERPNGTYLKNAQDYMDQVEASARMNFTVWNINDANTAANGTTLEATDTLLRDWLTVRTDVFDALLSGLAADIWQGSGTAADPYLIENEADLFALTAKAHALSGNTFAGVYFKQTADITLTSPWRAIQQFNGVYDGDFHTISNLNVTNYDEYAIGGTSAGFAQTLNGTIKNLGVESGTINVDSPVRGNSGNVGTFAATNNGAIMNCYSKATVVSSGSSAGGLAGDNGNGKIINSYFAGSVGTKYAGGLVSFGRVYGGYNIGKVSGSAEQGAVHRVSSNKNGPVQYAYWRTDGEGDLAASGGTMTSSEGKTTAEMQSEDFAALLNDNRAAVAAAAGVDIGELATWQYHAGGYPTLARTAATGKIDSSNTTVTVTGSAALTAEVSVPEGATVAYQWLRASTADGSYTAISGATGMTYTLTTADAGKFVKFQVSGVGAYEGAVQSEPLSGSLWQGRGTVDSPYLVADEAQLIAIRTTNTTGSGVYFRQTADITLTANWTPIGSFSGVYDGDGHTISNLHMSATGNTHIAMIHTLQSGGVLKNLGVASGTIVSEVNQATFVANNYGLVLNCWSAADLSGSTSSSGGLVAAGMQGGKVVNSYFLGTIAGAYTAGISSFAYSGVYGCYNAGKVSGATEQGAILRSANSNTYTKTNPVVFSYWQNEGEGFVGTSGGILQYAQGYSESYIKSQDFVDLMNANKSKVAAAAGVAEAELWNWSCQQNGYPTLTKADTVGISGSVSISGTPVYGQTLTAEVADITPAKAEYAYAWYRGGVEQAIGTGSTYRLTKADIGKQITLKVIGAGSFTGTLEATLEAPVGKIAVAAPVKLKATAQSAYGVNDGKISGLYASSVYEYKTEDASAYTQAQTGVTELTGLAPAAYLVRVAETETTNASEAAAVTVDAAPQIAITGAVSVKGDAKFGQTLTADISGIEQKDATLTYAWYRGDDQQTVVETAASYTLMKQDIGKVITLKVSGTGAYSGALTAVSGSVVKADGPAAPAAPTVAAKTETTVTLNTAAGQEYRIGTDGAWQTSGEFTGLKAGGTYSFFARVAETDTAFAGAASAALEVTLAAQTGATVSGSASFGAGKVPQLAALTAENGLTIDADSAVSGDYTLTRTVDATAGKHSVTFAVTKTGETKAAISVKLTGVNEDLSGVTATFKAASLGARAFTFDLNMVPAGTYSVEAYKKNHTVGAITGIPVETAPVDLGKTLEMLAGDLNGDNQITIADKTLLVGRFSTSNTEYDVNDDGSITILDKTLLVAQFSKKGKTVHF
ncbi:MAG: CotH kinase family protein [Eubacteriales bacterium]|nr:CotH kinase family protein [Eubacteriales bacterium]